MALSPYTIDVGPCRTDGTREIFLQHHQRACFSTTHREVLRVCLVKWPAKPSIEEATHTTDLDEMEAIRAQRAEDAYQTLLATATTSSDSVVPEKPSTADALGDAALGKSKGNDTTRSTQRDHTTTFEDYLCVFHREELPDQHGRYTFVQPQTICTAYRVKDTTPLQLVLHTVSPRDIATSATGSGGVFLHGRRQTTKGVMGWSSPVEFRGLLYKPAADAWWMSSPLTLKPVYVAVGPVASMAVAGSTPAATAAASFPSAPQVALAAQKTAGDTAEACMVASPLHVSDDPERSMSPYSSPRQGSPVAAAAETATTAAAFSARGEGRTALGQFDFPRSRSATPTPHSPPSSASLSHPYISDARGAQEGQAASSSSCRVQPTLQSPANPKSKFVPLNATVLAQLPLDIPTHPSSAPCSSLAVVRTASNELGIAVLTPLYALDAMLWQWWPHRVRFSKLASSASALSVVSSPPAQAAEEQQHRQLLFLYDAHYSRLRVLRTPDLQTGDGELELLFTFPCGDLPFVFPCLHTSTHPAPIAVCNYPRANWISVYDVPTLLEAPAPDTAALQLNLGAHQAVHAQRFGEVRLLGQTDQDAGESSAEMAEAAAVAGELDGSLQAKWNYKERNAKSWAAEAENGTDVAVDTSGIGATATATHPIRSLLYHCDAKLVLQYDWPSGAANRVHSTEGPAVGSGSTHKVNTGDDGRHRRRQRCEGTIAYTVQFPHFCKDDQPLLVFVLEALAAVLGARAAAALEYELFDEAWRGSCGSGTRVDPFRACTTLLRKLCKASDHEKDAKGVGSHSSNEHGDSSVRQEKLPETEHLNESCMFVDPSMLTLQSVQTALTGTTANTQVDALQTPSDETRHAVKSKQLFSWTTQQSGLALVALHLLFESCRLQEPLWSLLSPLAELNYTLSVQMRWASYIDYYSALVPITASMAASESIDADAETTNFFTECLPTEVLNKVFSYLKPSSTREEAEAVGGEREVPCSLRSAASSPAVGHFAAGDVPNLFQILSLLAMGSNNMDNSVVVQRAWPMLRCVPESHPIALANRLILLYRDVFSPTTEAATSQETSAANAGTLEGQWWKRICTQLLERQISARVVRQVLNTGVAYPLLEALTKGREHAEANWPAALLDLVGRRDRCPPTARTAQLISAGQHVVEAAESNAVALQIRAALTDDDGVSVRPDFRKTWRDARLDAAQNLFNTVTPISLSGFEDRPEELVGALELLSSRARAMPLGRGMLTMCTQSFKVQDSIPIPPLNLNGRTNDGINIVNKSTEDLMWPLFHNGCAAGLRFLPLPPSFCAGLGSSSGGGGVEDDVHGSADAHGDAGGNEGTRSSTQCDTTATSATPSTAAAAQTITKQWVMYQTKNIGNAASRAGLLLATGILGHLTVLQRTDIFYLLISRQEQYVWREATTMAVMLGLSCSFCGTSSEAVFRCLSVHVQSLNPSAEDIEVSLDVQTAALVSMGLLCQQAPSNTFLVEVFLVEISRLPTDEHCSKREGYVLGAGFGLGQLLLGVGAAHGVPHVEDRLLAFMEGAPRKSAVSAREGVEYFEETMGRGEAGHFLARALLSQDQREAAFNACASVYEGDCYNVFISGPAAVVALGFMYLQTDNAFIAAKIAPPDRRSAMQRLTPLLCHLRSTMASLIRWSNVRPTRAWLYAQLPSTLLQLTTAVRVPGLAVQQRNYLLMNLAHCLSGQVMALGLRYAGTMDTQVRDVILAELHGFLGGQIGTTRTPIPAVQRATGAYEACTLSCACALSLVMAGTGDVRVFGALQHLHCRTNVPYGSHMALSMSLGLLFLGSGRLTLSNNIASVAALFMAFYPLWPADAEDNTHHLQALRHLYGLAVVPRVMEAVDAVSHQPVSVPVRIVLRPTDTSDPTPTSSNAQGSAEALVPPAGGAVREIRTRTPCLYPPAEMIERIEVRDPRHYPLTFTAASVELTQSASMEFRVMAKDGAVRHGSRHSPLEARLVDWLHRVFHQPTTTAAEALTVMDSVRLLRRVQRRLVATTVTGAMLLSGDFGAAVMEAMEKRYSFLFLHRTDGSVKDFTSVLKCTSEWEEGAAPTTPQHPLHQLIVQGRSYRSVLESVAATPHGTAAFPCDFTSLISTSRDDPVPDNRYHQEETLKPEMGGALGEVDLHALHRWLTEALYFYGLRRVELQRIRNVLRGVSSQPGFEVKAGEANSSALSSTLTVKRLRCLLRLQAATQLPFSTLERVWDCCFS